MEHPSKPTMTNTLKESNRTLQRGLRRSTEPSGIVKAQDKKQNGNPAENNKQLISDRNQEPSQSDENHLKEESKLKTLNEYFQSMKLKNHVALPPKRAVEDDETWDQATAIIRFKSHGQSGIQRATRSFIKIKNIPQSSPIITVSNRQRLSRISSRGVLRQQTMRQPSQKARVAPPGFGIVDFPALSI
jgi:hypothetical protein